MTSRCLSLTFSFSLFFSHPNLCLLLSQSKCHTAAVSRRFSPYPLSFPFQVSNPLLYAVCSRLPSFVLDYRFHQHFIILY